MKVTINKQESTITLEYGADEFNRFARIEMDILRSCGFLNSQPVSDHTRRLSQEPLRRFTEEQYDKVVKILSGYCLTPTFV